MLLPKGTTAQISKNKFAESDATNQLRPTIYQADFYQEKDFDLGWLLLEPINFNDSLITEAEWTKRFSPGQKALYFWWYLDAQVTNGGFIQFYFNDYAQYVPAILEGLKLIGDKDLEILLKKAHALYLAHQVDFEKASQEEFPTEKFYDKMEEMYLLDIEYYDLNEQTMALIEKYARTHTEAFCVDERGEIIDGQYTGACQKLYDNGQVNEKFELINGEINGDLVTFYESGKLESKTFYSLGKPTGKFAEWYENGKIAARVGVHSKTGFRKKEKFHENGEKAQLYFENEDGSQQGLERSWYNNGQLKEESTYVESMEREGKWMKFWSDGSKKMEAEFRYGQVYFQNYWTEEGKQILTDGTGLYIHEYQFDLEEEARIFRHETSYKNYEKHGVSKTIVNDVLLTATEYKNGYHHGWLRVYNDDGSVKSETLYENGTMVKAPKVLKKS